MLAGRLRIAFDNEGWLTDQKLTGDIVLVLDNARRSLGEKIKQSGATIYG